MDAPRFVYWQDGSFWLGHLEEFPDYLTQGESLADLKAHLRDLYADLTISPNQRIGFHADARYNVYDLGLREANADVRVVDR